MWRFGLLLFCGWLPWSMQGNSGVDECADSSICPSRATCIDTPDSYYCTCKRGFQSSSGLDQFTDPGVKCNDVDECSLNASQCGPNAICTNTLGRYKCSCFPGFSSSTGDNWSPGKPGHFLCKDIDECVQDPSPCGPDSVCTNTLDSYSCDCAVGFRPNLGGSWKYGNFSCKPAPFKCKEDIIPNNKQVLQCQANAALGAEYVPFCALMNATFSILDEACRDATTTVISLQRMAEKFSPVLEKLSNGSSLTKAETAALGTILLESVGSTVLAAFLSPSANGSQTIRTERLDIESRVIKDECAEENMVFHVKAGGSEMKIGCSTVKESESAGTTGVAFVSFASLESVLDESFFQDPQNPLANSRRKLKMNSRVVAGVMTGVKKGGFSDPVVYTVENIEPKQKSERPICVSWSADVGGGRWTSSGCVVRKVSETSTECSCNRMVNLAIIMASGPLTMESSLYILSHVGLIISLLCLAVAIATFLLCRAIRNHNTYLHLHLCVCLFLAESLFLTGADKTDNQTVCALIAGFLHYLFLACFFWMLVEAAMLFLMVRNLKVVNYFSSRNIKMLHLCVFAYGTPALVVAVSASVQPKGYGMHDRCWLNTETGFVWSFLGPVCTIIMINFILLTWTLWILKQKLSSVNAEVSTLKDSRLLTLKAFAQLFILGCSWVFGIFQIGPVASVMAYLFTVINSLQGAFIFIIHCLLSRQVREEYRRWFSRKTKPSSQSQTSRVFLSSMPSTSKTG